MTPIAQYKKPIQVVVIKVSLDKERRKRCISLRQREECKVAFFLPFLTNSLQPSRKKVYSLHVCVCVLLKRSGGGSGG